MSASSRCVHEEQPEDADLGLGHGCQPGGLPPFQMLRRHRRSSITQDRLFEPTAAQDSAEINGVKRPTNPLMKLTSKLGLHSKTKCVSQADDGVQERRESDTVALGTSLKQQKMMFHHDMMNIEHRRNVDLQQLGASGTLCKYINKFLKCQQGSK